MLRQYFLRQYFAQALLNKGVLSREQVVCLLASKDEHQSTIAMRALSQKVMTAAQIEEILKREEDPEKFGALAVAAGYMTQSQLRSLEEMESNTNLDFSQGLGKFDEFGPSNDFLPSFSQTYLTHITPLDLAR